MKYFSINKIKCLLGFHNWKSVRSNIYEEKYVLFRTYMICTRCKKWGKLKFHITEGIINK